MKMCHSLVQGTQSTRPIDGRFLSISSSMAFHPPLPLTHSSAQGDAINPSSLFPRYSSQSFNSYSGAQQRLVRVKQCQEEHFDRPAQGESSISEKSEFAMIGCVQPMGRRQAELSKRTKHQIERDVDSRGGLIQVNL